MATRKIEFLSIAALVNLEIPEIVRRIAEAHINVNEAVDPDERHAPILHSAITMGAANVVQALVNCGADPNRKNDQSEQFTALHLACLQGEADSLRILMTTRGADLKAKTAVAQKSLLHCGIQHPDIIRMLVLQEPSLVTMPNLIGETPLMKAAELGPPNSLAIAKILIEECRLDPETFINLTDKKQCTALHKAVESNDSDLVGYLLTKGAKQNKNTDGFTPLELAQGKGYSTCSRKFAQRLSPSLVPAAAKSPRRSSGSGVPAESSINRRHSSTIDVRQLAEVLAGSTDDPAPLSASPRSNAALRDSDHGEDVDNSEISDDTSARSPEPSFWQKHWGKTVVTVSAVLFVAYFIAGCFVPALFFGLPLLPGLGLAAKCAIMAVIGAVSGVLTGLGIVGAVKCGNRCRKKDNEIQFSALPTHEISRRIVPASLDLRKSKVPSPAVIPDHGFVTNFSYTLQCIASPFQRCWNRQPSPPAITIQSEQRLN